MISIYYIKDEDHIALKYHLNQFMKDMYFHTDIQAGRPMIEHTRKTKLLFNKLIVSRTTKWCDSCKAFFMYLRFHKVDMKLWYTPQEITALFGKPETVEAYKRELKLVEESQAIEEKKRTTDVIHLCALFNKARVLRHKLLKLGYIL